MSPKSIDSTELRAVAAAFRLGGSYCGGAPYGTGHINDTFAISFEQGGVTTRYILQRINENVFRNVDAVMENVARVTAHAGRRAVASGAWRSVDMAARNSVRALSISWVASVLSTGSLAAR